VDHNKVIKKIKERMLEIHRGEHGDIYYGIAFGKYDMVIDFSATSIKVSSFKLCNMVEALCKKWGNGICETFIFGKEIHAKGISKSKIRSYTFISIKPSEEQISKLIKMLQDYDNVALLWNISLYNLILVCYGETFEEVVGKVQEIRTKISDIIVDGSTLITLNADDSDRKMADDHVAVVYLKLTKLKCNQLRLPDNVVENVVSFDGYQSPIDRLGWFDCCIFLKFRSLKSLYDAIIALLQYNREEVLLSSTMFLHKG
jgi:hypothetical protein